MYFATTHFAIKRRSDRGVQRVTKVVRHMAAIAPQLARTAGPIAMLLALGTLGCARLASAAPDPQAARDVDWREYGLDASATRYSPLSAINAESVKRLGLAWSLDLPGELGLEATPIEVDGVIYFSGSFASVYAVAVASGKLLWKYDPDAGPRIRREQRMMYNINRGVAYSDHRVFVCTRDGRMIALDSRTGAVEWTSSTLVPGSTATSTGAPRVFRDKVIIGNSGAEAAQRGYVTAFDTRTGKVAWRFFVVPGDPAKGFENHAMEMAAKTWSGEWWRYGGGGTPWNGITFDEELGQIYIGTGNGGPYDMKLRAAGMQDNLFVASVVALNAQTGEYLWHYQYNPLEVWDWKATADIVLAELPIDGQKRKVLMQAPSNGFFYVIDRHTGKLISAEKIGKVNWADRIDIATGRPVERPGIRYENAPITLYPGVLGAHNWQAMSFSPQTGLVYIPYMQAGSKYWRSAEAEPYGKKPLYQGFYQLGTNYDISIDPTDPMDGRSSLLAWDPVKQKIRWRVDHPTIFNGGTAVTAGGLVFQSLETGQLVAYDAKDGSQRWSYDVGHGIIAPPITYSHAGRQYVSVLAGFGGAGGEGGQVLGQVTWSYAAPRRLLTFALDGNASLPAANARAGSVHVLDDPSLQLDENLVQRGELLYENSCSLCHGDSAVSSGGAPDLRASAVALNLNAFRQVLSSGRVERGMPKFDDVTPRDVESVYQFIRGMARRPQAASSEP
jgi:quinohemoprotein ethanol dehydrogenase